jgi:hypothetical protein
VPPRSESQVSKGVSMGGRNCLVIIKISIRTTWTHPNVFFFFFLVRTPNSFLRPFRHRIHSRRLSGLDHPWLGIRVGGKGLSDLVYVEIRATVWLPFARAKKLPGDEGQIIVLLSAITWYRNRAPISTTIAQSTSSHFCYDMPRTATSNQSASVVRINQAYVS